ncbi:MAG: glycosyltransferase family 4 protein [bacterium]|nr:glycosyltransferase family 4 protein [bacterium]
MSNRRILIFSLAYHPVEGGAEIAVKEITNRVFDIEFDMITMRFDEAHLPKEKIGNCTVYRINTLKNLYPFRAFFLAKKLHKDKPYDAIWAIMANWAGFAALFFKYRFPNIKYILTLQEGDSLEYIKKKVRHIYPLFKKIFTKADKIQAISNFLAKWAKQVGHKEEVEVIPNGVDVEKFVNKNVLSSALDKGGITLITTSRLVEKNAVADIIDALKFLPEKVSLKILGTGTLEQILRSQVINLKLENRVEFLGFIPPQEIPMYLHASDIFVRPSLSEGMGNSFIEAMAAGLPVIGTPVGGIVDFLRDGETGLFCEVNNPKSIAEKVIEYVNNPELTSKIVKNARKMVEEKYDWDLVAKRMKEEILDKV